MPSTSIFLHFITFLEISRNRLAALNDPPGDACSKNPNSGFSLWTASGWRRPARQHELGCPVFSVC